MKWLGWPNKDTDFCRSAVKEVCAADMSSGG